VEDVEDVEGFSESFVEGWRKQINTYISEKAGTLYKSFPRTLHILHAQVSITGSCPARD
jgi:hypothetical protein